MRVISLAAVALAATFGAYLILPLAAQTPEQLTFIPAGGRTLLIDIDILAFGPACADHFGRLRVLLRRGGVTVDSVDLMIASVALAHGLTLVTHNTADFAGIPGLALENWLTP